MAIHSLPSADEVIGDDIVAEINITPLTDIFLVLLIIFMVTTSVISSQGKNVDLPSSAVASQTPAGVTVTLTAEDEVAIDGAVVAGDAIAPWCSAARCRSSTWPRRPARRASRSRPSRRGRARSSGGYALRLRTQIHAAAATHSSGISSPTP